ncbi:MAG: VWA domain-containing protein [Acidobacteria bacterium]|nr:VWA domain-containing protein [Acidobacteriota bacterium]
MRPYSKPLLVVAFVVAPLLLSLHGDQAPKGQQGQKEQSRATFRSRVDYIQVDATVYDNAGQFVPDLTKDDFEVFEDGKKQNIDRIEVVNVPVEPRSLPALVSGHQLEPDVYTNEVPPGRLYLIVMDDLHVHPARSLAARRIARMFIEQNMAPNDVAALVVTSGNRRAAQEFTNNRRLLLEAVEKFQGRKIISPGLASLSTMGAPDEASADAADPQRMYNARTWLDTLASLSTFAGTIPSRRKSIVMIGEGPDLDIAANDILPMYAPLNNRLSQGETGVDPMKAEAPKGFPLARGELRDKLRDFIDAANRANVTLYAFDPSMYTQGGDDMVDIASANPGDYDAKTGIEIVRSSKVLDGIQAAQDNLRTVSTATGGFAVISRSFANAFERIRADNSRYYILGYYPTNDKRDGKYRKIDVRVRRAGLKVTARRGYVMPKADKQEAPVVETSEGTSLPLREALLSALPVAGLPIAVTAAPFNTAPGRASVLLMLQTPPGSVKFVDEGGRFNGKLEVSFVAVDELGKTTGGEHVNLAMPLKPDLYKMVNEVGLLVESRVSLPPGRYSLRVAARDENAGSIGSVHCDLEVPDYAKLPLSMSGVVIASAESMAANPRPDPERRRMLPDTPSVLRRFRQSDQLSVLTEVYDSKIATPHGLDIIATVINEQGQVVFRHEDTRSTREIQAAAGTTGGFGYVVKVPLAAIAPGSYVLAIEVRSRLDADKPVRHETAFTVVGR